MQCTCVRPEHRHLLMVAKVLGLRGMCWGCRADHNLLTHVLQGNQDTPGGHVVYEH